MKALVINPNSSSDMTIDIRNVISTRVSTPATQFSYWTAPYPSPRSLDSEADMHKSTEVVLATVTKEPEFCDASAVIVACFSVHTLVPLLPKRAVGIFEAAVKAAKQGVQDGRWEKWGIITTTQDWVAPLDAGVQSLLTTPEERDGFSAVLSTGLSASEFHALSRRTVDQSVVAATERMMSVMTTGAVIVGCAAMSGVAEIIRATSSAQFHIIDGLEEAAKEIERLSHEAEKIQIMT